MKHKAFSLMELMIVIVIIGILAAGSLIIFGDKADKAKIAVTKTNHKNITNFMATEIMNCNLGDSHLNLLKSNGSPNKVSCDTSSVNTITLGSQFVNHFWGENVENAYKIVVNGKTYAVTGNSPYLGQTQIVSAGGNKILVRTKFTGDEGQWKGGSSEALISTIIDTR